MNKSTTLAGIVLFDWTVEQIVTDLYLEIAMLAHISHDSSVQGITIKQLLARDQDDSDGAIRHLFRSPYTADYLMEALELDDLSDLKDMFKQALEAAISQSIKLEVFTTWVDDLPDMLFRLKLFQKPRASSSRLFKSLVCSSFI